MLFQVLVHLSGANTEMSGGCFCVCVRAMLMQVL